MYKSIYKTFFEKNDKSFNRWKDMHYFGIRKTIAEKSILSELISKIYALPTFCNECIEVGTLKFV